MTDYVDIRLTRKQALAADDALAALIERAEEYMNLDRPLGTITAERALYRLRVALIEAVRG